MNYELEGKGDHCLVFIHGLGGTLHDFDLLCESRLKLNHRILRLDLRGFGKSEKPLSPVYSTELWANDVHHLMESLKIEKAVICGHSMGARIAAHFAHLYPWESNGLISLDMTFWGSNPSGAEILDKLAKTVLEKGMQAACSLIPPFSCSRMEERVKAEILGNAPKAFVLAMKSVAEDYRTKRSDLFFQKIQCPSLVLMGDKDIAPLDGSLELRKQLTHSVAHMAMIPDCNHYSMLEQPHLVSAVIQEFLERKSL